MKQFYKELKATIFIIAAIVAIVLVISLFSKYSLGPGAFIILISYLITLVILSIIDSKFKISWFDKFAQIYAWPAGIFYALLLVSLPFLALTIHVVFYFCIAAIIPEITYKGLSYFGLIDFIKPPTILYLRITLSLHSTGHIC